MTTHLVNPSTTAREGDSKDMASRRSSLLTVGFTSGSRIAHATGIAIDDTAWLGQDFEIEGAAFLNSSTSPFSLLPRRAGRGRG